MYCGRTQRRRDLPPLFMMKRNTSIHLTYTFILFSAWFIYKKRCQYPDCGYIDASFLCDERFAYLNYDLDNEYTITVKCNDAYGSDDTETFTLKVMENQPPVFTNTPSKFMN
jgi:hypothetical protein